MKTGAKLKNLRKMKKLSQEEVAKVLNLSYSTLSRWENDTRIPTYEDLFKLGQFYGVSVDYLSDPNEESFYWS
ncbi:XRE family transcriptional regulator [Coprobacillus sp. OF03-2AA]|nr:XRE family transcriptional regulator [Coprobacillus sp. OF03-2AA]